MADEGPPPLPTIVSSLYPRRRKVQTFWYVPPIFSRRSDDCTAKQDGLTVRHQLQESEEYMIRSARPRKGPHAAYRETAIVEILIRKVDALGSETEKVALFGFVDDGRSLSAGFTLSCTIE